LLIQISRIYARGKYLWALKKLLLRFITDSPTFYPIKDERDPQNTRKVDVSAVPVNGYRAAYLSGRTTPTEVAKTLIANIQHSKTIGLNALIKHDEREILRRAIESTERYRTKSSIGPLDGVPVSVKDEMDALPYTTSVGTSFLNDLPTEDATAVARMRAAGAIIIGKANMHELGTGYILYLP
jgi:Asp-tRNA(Asn)/Glu-tRNA(Gln) amidotransferase A subunit family amidase